MLEELLHSPSSLGLKVFRGFRETDFNYLSVNRRTAGTACYAGKAGLLRNEPAFFFAEFSTCNTFNKANTKEKRTLYK